AIMPSPVCLISLPPYPTRASRTMRLWARTTCWATASPLVWVRSVEPTMSVNKTVTNSDSPTMTAELKGEQIVIKFQFPRGDNRFVDTVSRVKTLSGRRFDKSIPGWTVPLGDETVDHLKEWGFRFNRALNTWLDGQREVTPVSIDLPGLRPFQLEGIAFVESRNGRALIGDEMGTGKTCQALSYLQLHPELRPAILLVPASVKLNWQREIAMWMSTGVRTAIISGHKVKKKALTSKDLIIINYDILKHWREALQSIGPRALVIDECFPAGTMISTPSGSVNISDIKSGDIVMSAIGPCKVRNVISRFSSNLITLNLSNGDQIRCTANHPIFTDNGWLPANLCIKRKVFSSVDIYDILDSTITYKPNRGKYETTKKNKTLSALRRLLHYQKRPIPNKEILQHLLLSKMENVTTRNQKENVYQRALNENFQSQERNKKPRRFRIYDKAQSGNKTRSNEKNQGALGKIWPSFISSTFARWQRKTFAITTKNIVGSIRPGMENRICSQDQEASGLRVSYKLQTRYSQSKNKDGYRSRRLDTSNARREEKRQEKNRSFDGIWVDSITFPKPRNHRLPSVGIKRDPIQVFNLEIEGHPSYFANGILVHNCQMIKNKNQRSDATFKLGKDIECILGLSGTPIDNQPIEFYNILKLIRPTLFPSKWSYAHDFCDAKHNGFAWDFTGASNIDKLYKIVQRVMIRRKKIDVLPELPPIVRSVIPMEIDNRTAYNKVADQVVQELKTKELENPDRQSMNALAMVLFERLKQAAVDGKMEFAINWIQDYIDAGEKLIVFAWHKKTVADLLKHFGDIAVSTRGANTPTKRQEAVDRFQLDPAVRLFIGNLKRDGVGHNLTAASATCHVELGWTSALHDQAEARPHRIGQEADSVNAYYLLAVDTVEEDVAAIIDHKRKVLGQILDGEEAQADAVLTTLLKKVLKRK
ncbi:hypothetical protein LCGC14_1117210, partial [marine sediment metagenome]